MPRPAVGLRHLYEPRPDPFAIDCCIDGDIAFRRITLGERDEVARQLTARGMSPGDIARRVHASTNAVHDALARVAARDQQQQQQQAAS